MSNPTETPSPAAQLVSLLLDPPEGYEKWLMSLRWLPQNELDMPSYCNGLARRGHAIGLSETATIEIAVGALTHSEFTYAPEDIERKVSSAYAMLKARS